jgi:hypothetical protein
MLLEQWNALSGRIRGLVQAGRLFNDSQLKGSHGIIAKQLQQQIGTTLADLDEFSRAFARSLPPPAINAIKSCVRQDGEGVAGMLKYTSGSPPNQWHDQIWAALVMLAAFETEMTFHLSDVQAAIRARSERAFEHLKRLIIVDTATREQWNDDLHKGGEVACEKRGAVHLLWHGIFAFKVNAAGGRTDLVFPQPVDGLSAQRFADGLVLTEWKVARSGSDDEIRKKFAEACDQAKRYTQGVLAGELITTRYVVVVSRQPLPSEPEDRLDRDAQGREAVYRHINIAVEPETPSKGSRRRGRS